MNNTDPPSTSTIRKSNYIHAVISNQTPPELKIVYDEIMLVFKPLELAIANELGSGSNPHIDFFIKLEIQSRTDVFRKKLLNLKCLKDVPEEEHRNIRCFINKKDANPKYGFGYTLKEGLSYILYNISEQYRLESMLYYEQNQIKPKKISMDVNELYSYLKDKRSNSVENFSRDDITFYLQILLNKNLVLFTTVSRLNIKLLLEVLQ